ncbi:MAG: single-stranded-DNA-specific exonuclease RecJ [Pseudomonadales bacterium]|nr:single-stranded-DNA-specific exonuclease RecJ [Pseudomonadales bacterium]
MQIQRRVAPENSDSLKGFSVLERIYAQRGIRDSEELDLGLGKLLKPGLLPDIDIAADRLCQAVIEQERILIVGDFDADGATSVALCVLVLGAYGAKHVDYLVPNRFEYGYGLSPEIVQLAQTMNPAVLVTVDNGVSSIAGVALAQKEGIDVIVTDHHLPGIERPAALALVNPNLPESEFSSGALAGVGVAYYVLGVLRQKLVDQGWFEERPMPNLANYLDLVALGTVADVVPLDSNNRRLVQQGLLRIRAGRCRPGIKALAEIGKRTLSTLSAQDLGFAIGPRLNAAGRLEDMAIGIKCLLAEDFREARQSATALDQLNVARRQLERDMVGDAELLLATDQADTERTGLSVYHESFHQGVVGIVAGRLRERFHKPVICFADAGDLAPDELKGSARSIDGLHIRDVLDQVATQHPGLLLKFGGHAMAAGLSIKRVHLERFGVIFDKAVATNCTPDMLQAVLLSDGPLEESELDIETAHQLAAGGPWGSQFPEPLFDGEFELVSQRVVGSDHLKIVLKSGHKVIDGIAFRQAPLPTDTKRVEVAYRLSVNDYGQVQTAQVVVEYIRSIT